MLLLVLLISLGSESPEIVDVKSRAPMLIGWLHGIALLLLLLWIARILLLLSKLPWESSPAAVRKKMQCNIIQCNNPMLLLQLLLFRLLSKLSIDV